MREGRGLNHVGYAFLSFYKILETPFPKDTDPLPRTRWENSAMPAAAQN